MMTIAKQRRADVDRARQFFQKPQSSEDRKVQLDNLEQKFPCARCGQLGHRKDDNDCPAKVKVVDWREQCATTSSLSSAHGAEARALDEAVWVTPGTVEVTKGVCSSKLVGELCTVSCVSGDSNSLELPQIFLYESDESLLHIFRPENFTGVADVCSYVPNLDDSVVSDCVDTPLRTGDTCTVKCAAGDVLGVRDTEQTFSCQPDGVVSGT